MNIAVHQNHKEEKRRDAEFWALQQEIEEKFGVAMPEAPKLQVCSSTNEWNTDFESPSSGTSPKHQLLSNGLLSNWPPRNCVRWTSIEMDKDWQRYHLQRRTLRPSYPAWICKPNILSSLSSELLLAPYRPILSKFAPTVSKIPQASPSVLVTARTKFCWRTPRWR